MRDEGSLDCSNDRCRIMSTHKSVNRQGMGSGLRLGQLEQRTYCSSVVVDPPRLSRSFLESTREREWGSEGKGRRGTSGNLFALQRPTRQRPSGGRVRSCDDGIREEKKKKNNKNNNGLFYFDC